MVYVIVQSFVQCFVSTEDFWLPLLSLGGVELLRCLSSLNAS